jgi:DNA primase
LADRTFDRGENSWDDELLDAIDVLDMLESLPLIRNIAMAGDEVNFSCPFPGHSFGDEHPSAYMNVDNRLWHCHGCKRGGDAVSFLAQLENVSEMQAVRWLTNRYLMFREPEGLLIEEIDGIIEKAARRRDTRREQQVLPDTAMAQFRAIDWRAVEDAMLLGRDVPLPLVYMMERGFHGWTLNGARVLYDPRTERIVLPIFDAEGQLVGFRGRAWQPDHEPRYMALGDTPRSIAARGEQYGFQPYYSGDHLWGLNNAEETGRLVLVEGEFNAMACRQVGVTDAVGLQGSTVTPQQQLLLRKHAERVVILFDDFSRNKNGKLVVDTAGREGRDNAVCALEPYMRVLVAPTHEEDPADMLLHSVAGDELRALVDNAQPAIMMGIF